MLKRVAISIVFGAAVGLALGPCAFAQTYPKGSPQMLASAALPRVADPPTHGVIPGVGPTPGIILQAETPAAKCSRSAVAAADGRMLAGDALADCNQAIVDGVTTPPDMVATLVNRGVLLMTMNRPADALNDFDSAVETDPTAAEALINRGVIRQSQGQSRQALADLDAGIALGSERAERAYFTRALARESLGDIQGAYADYKMAEQLSPGWQPAVQELTRFKVVSK